MSEYGSGYATCLRQFVNHESRISHFLGLPMDEAMGVGLWANGASDHFYELQRPKGLPDPEWDQAQALASRMLHIGHGFMPDSKSTEAEVRMWVKVARELLARLETPTSTIYEAMQVDIALGLDPDEGEWACPQDLGFRDDVPSEVPNLEVDHEMPAAGTSPQGDREDPDRRR